MRAGISQLQLQLVMSIICIAHSAPTTFHPDPCTPKHSADKVFRHWSLRTGASMRSLQLHRQTQQYTGSEHELFQNGQVCILKVAYDGLGHFTASPPGEQGTAFCIKEVAFEIRMVPILAGLNVALAASLEFVQLDPFPFEFFMDMHDHNVITWDIVKQVGLPVVSSAAAMHDTWTLPLPCAYFLLAAACTAGRTETLQRFDNMHEFAAVYNLSLPLVSWESKIPKMVYRGGCVLTKNPDTPDTYHPLRSTICPAVNSSDLVDVNIGELDNQCTMPWNKESCEACRPCMHKDSNRNMNRAGQMMHKYQLVADGFGPSWDGTFWKLYSGGAVFWLTPHGVKLWDMWYTTLFNSNLDYIVTTPSQLLANIQWCRDNDDVCAEIGARSHRKVACHLKPLTGLIYTAKVMQRLQQFYLNKSGDTPVLPTSSL